MDLHQLLLNYECTAADIQLLIKDDNVNETDDIGNSPLHYALITKCKPEIIQLLINCGADVNLKGVFSKYPLHRPLSYSEPQIDVIKILLSRDANVNAVDCNGDSPLHYALLSQCKLHIIKLLVDFRADVNLKSGKYSCNSPLHRAVKSAVTDIKIIEYLLSVGADVNALDCDKNTSLYYAITYHNFEVVKLLLNYRAELKIESKKISLLEAIEKFKDKESLECVKLFILYNLIENVELNYSEVLDTCSKFNSLQSFVTECRLELEKMKSDYITGVTLHEVIRNMRGKIGTQDINIDCDVNEVLKLLKHYTLYRELISFILIKRGTVFSKLTEVLSHLAIKGIFSLDYFSACKVASYLPKQDIINMVLAFQDLHA